MLVRPAPRGSGETAPARAGSPGLRALLPGVPAGAVGRGSRGAPRPWRRASRGGLTTGTHEPGLVPEKGRSSPQRRAARHVPPLRRSGRRPGARPVERKECSDVEMGRARATPGCGCRAPEQSPREAAPAAQIPRDATEQRLARSTCERFHWVPVPDPAPLAFLPPHLSSSDGLRCAAPWSCQPWLWAAPGAPEGRPHPRRTGSTQTTGSRDPVV